MYYAKIKNVSHAEAVQIISRALTDQNLSLRDLVKRIRYPFESKGMKELEGYLLNGCVDEIQVRTKIGAALGIDHELLHGERAFEKYEDYCRFIFVPYLARIPEKTHAASGSGKSFAYFGGLRRACIVGKYSSLLDKPLENQLKFIKLRIDEDQQVDTGRFRFLGATLGFAFYFDYDQPAIPLSVDGNVIDDYVITYDENPFCNILLKASNIAQSERFMVPRLISK